MASKTSTRKAISAERKKKALEFRRAGLSYDKIGEQLQISKTQAYRLVTKALEELASEARDEAELVRVLELERLDRMLLGLWTKATAGHLGSVEKVLKIMERRAKLIGLDKPTKVAATDPEGNEALRDLPSEELDKRIAELQDKLGITDAQGAPEGSQ